MWYPYRDFRLKVCCVSFSFSSRRP